MKWQYSSRKQDNLQRKEGHFILSEFLDQVGLHAITPDLIDRHNSCMFLLISSVAHETVSVNKEMGKSLALHLKNGEMNRNVVGEKEGAGQMKIESQGLLLQIARDAITCHLEDRIPSKLQGLGAELLQRLGAFVTLHKGGQLRGCVGQIVSDNPLYETVAAAAIGRTSQKCRNSKLRFLS